MFLKTSRYARVQTFAEDPDGRAAFRGVRPRPIPATQGVLEHTQTDNDRPDLLAQHFYQQDRAWWRLLDANPGALIAGPVRGQAGARVTDGVSATGEPGAGWVLICDEMTGDAVLVPARKE